MPKQVGQLLNTIALAYSIHIIKAVAIGHAYIFYLGLLLLVSTHKYNLNYCYCLDPNGLRIIALGQAGTEETTATRACWPPLWAHQIKVSTWGQSLGTQRSAVISEFISLLCSQCSNHGQQKTIAGYPASLPVRWQILKVSPSWLVDACDDPAAHDQWWVSYF